jgi:hypothetical protein
VAGIVASVVDMGNTSDDGREDDDEEADMTLPDDSPTRLYGSLHIPNFQSQALVTFVSHHGRVAVCSPIHLFVFIGFKRQGALVYCVYLLLCKM